jgi:hypothetical protein
VRTQFPAGYVFAIVGGVAAPFLPLGFVVALISFVVVLRTRTRYPDRPALGKVLAIFCALSLAASILMLFFPVLASLVFHF